MQIQAVHEDQELLVVNKPSGLIVHSARQESLESLVRTEIAKKAVLLNRLDQGTSGLVMFAKRSSFANAFNELIRRHQLRKTYWALVDGLWPKQVNKIDLPLEKVDTNRWWVAVGQSGAQTPDHFHEKSRPHGINQVFSAVTTFRVLKHSQSWTWLEVLPKTGRTHQIRVHTAATGHAILGDTKYQGLANSVSATDTNVSLTPQFALHAVGLRLRQPLSGEQLSLACLPTSYQRWDQLDSQLKQEHLQKLVSK